MLSSLSAAYFIHQCERSDPEINKCLQYAANTLVRHFRSGESLTMHDGRQRRQPGEVWLGVARRGAAPCCSACRAATHPTPDIVSASWKSLLHLEPWTVRTERNNALVTLSPPCRLTALPNLAVCYNMKRKWLAVILRVLFCSTSRYPRTGGE